MEKAEKKKFFYSFLFPALFVALLWIIHGIAFYAKIELTSFGILPRSLDGLKGILFSPLIHGDLNHLFNNSVPLILLGWALFYFYRQVAFKVAFWSYILAGFYTWISARTSYHIGASGLVYALFGFLFISGFIRKYTPLIALSFLVAFLYGSLIWGILPWDKSMSWEGHFWGLFVGLILAFFYRKQGPQRKVFQWDEDEFNSTEDPEEDETPLDIVYHFVPKDEEKKSL
ncbi:MAG: rhomboid family intramembrane serine protease [Vicingaceae bacterium]